MTGDNGAQQQYAALPWRRRADAAIEIMLLTSRDTGRWVIPKGWPVRGLSPAQSAAQEAREEGGLVGQVAERSIGRYHYNKRLSNGSSVMCAVEVFALEVDKQLRSWPERNERRTQWFALQEAAGAVDEQELADLIRALPEKLA
jgi:8-oxo-dGTP pyrophosphatase MutT (NUDIX family)